MKKTVLHLFIFVAVAIVSLVCVYASDVPLASQLNYNSAFSTDSAAPTDSANPIGYVDSGSCGDNVTCTLDSDGLLTISGTGAMDSYSYYSDSPWATKTVKTVVISEGVTSIGDYAFEGCTGLTSITIPDSVTSIGEDAFSGCTGLTSITIPDSVTSIGDLAFFGCTGLESISVSGNNTVYHSSGNCLIKTETKELVLGCKNSIIPTNGSVTSIGSRAFSGCTGLTSITIPDSVTSIGSSAFRGCTGLTSITIPDSVTSIDSYAFSGCTGLTSITLGKGVTYIGESAFEYCSNIACNIEIPDSIISVGKDAFSDCYNLRVTKAPFDIVAGGNFSASQISELKAVSIKSVEQWVSYDFTNKIFKKNQFCDCGAKHW